MELIKKIQQLAPECTIINHYGPTEATVGVLTYQLEPENCKYESTTVPLGPPSCQYADLFIRSVSATGSIGVKGEIYIGGASLTRGYLHYPELK